MQAEFEQIPNEYHAMMLGRWPHPDEADSSQAGGEGDNAAEEAQDAHYHPRPAHGCIGDLPRIRAGSVLMPRVF